MINEDLKNKIIDYLDGNLDKPAEQEVEDILSSNNEANDFYNEMKRLDISLNEFKTSQDYLSFSKKADEVVDEFIDNNLPKTSKQNTFSFLNNILTRNALGYSLTALFFLTIGINLNNSNTKNTPYEFDLEDTTVERTFFKTRDISSSNLFFDLLEKTIEEMVKNNSAKGKISYGSKTYVVNLDDLTIKNDELKCYSGSVYDGTVTDKIYFCLSADDTSLIFTN